MGGRRGKILRSLTLFVVHGMFIPSTCLPTKLVVSHQVVPRVIFHSTILHLIYYELYNVNPCLALNPTPGMAMPLNGGGHCALTVDS